MGKGGYKRYKVSKCTTAEVKESRAHRCYRLMQLDYRKVRVAGGTWVAEQRLTRDSLQKNSGEKHAIHLEGPNNLSLNQDNKGERRCCTIVRAARTNGIYLCIMSLQADVS